MAKYQLNFVYTFFFITSLAEMIFGIFCAFEKAEKAVNKIKKYILKKRSWYKLLRLDTIKSKNI